MMILLFLGNWRLTLIILATIPLAIITAVLVMYVGGQTLNTMTLGGFALAVGILVDNGTVVIENIERHVHEGEPLTEAIIARRRRSRRSDGALDAVHLHRLRAGVPAARHGKISVLSAIPVGLRFADREPRALLHLGAGPVRRSHAFVDRGSAGGQSSQRGAASAIAIQYFRHIRRHSPQFEAGFNGFRETYRNCVAFCVARSGVVSAFFLVLMAGSLPLFPQLGQDFFPQVDAGQMRLHVRAPPASRLEETQRYFAEVETRHPPNRRLRTRSTSSWTISACPTAASTSRSAIRRPSGRWTAKS